MRRVAMVAFGFAFVWLGAGCSLVPMMMTCDHCGKGYRFLWGGYGRPEFSPARPYDASTGKLPGVVPDKADLKGVWLFTDIKSQTQQPDAGTERLFQSQYLWLRADGTYDLTYHAYWGKRRPDDPRFNGMQARETGRYHISGEILLFEPETSRVTRRKHGTRTVETITHERRPYIVRREKNTLHIAGRCADYEVEPICSQSTNVWYSLGLTHADVAAKIPEM